MKLKDWTLNGQHTSANDAPHRILWYDKKLSIALCVLTHTMCCLCFWGLGDSHGLASRERFQVSMRGWHQVLVIMVDKGKFKITIPKDYMLEACGWSPDGQVKLNTKQSFPHYVCGETWRIHQCLAFILIQEETSTSSSSERLVSKVLVPLTLVLWSDDHQKETYTLKNGFSIAM